MDKSKLYSNASPAKYQKLLRIKKILSAKENVIFKSGLRNGLD